MLTGAVNVIEFSVLLFSLFTALVSIVSPKVQNGLYTLLILLPFAFLVNKAEAKEDGLDD